MSNYINNRIYIKSDAETFQNIVNLLIDKEKDETTYEKFWPMPDGLDARQAYEWREANYGCTKGIECGLSNKQQWIEFSTNFDPAVKIVERLAQMFPAAEMEHSYSTEDDDYWLDYYKNGELTQHKVDFNF